MLKLIKQRFIKVTSDENTRLLSEGSSSDQIKDEDVLDKYHLVYWIFFIYGVAMLLPWNVFITASEYFAKRFSGTPYEETFQNYFSTNFTNTNLLTFVFVIYMQNKSSYSFDSFLSIFINTIIFGMLAITVETHIEGIGYFWFILILIVITGVTTSFFQNAVFSEASQLPPMYMQAVLSGQGIAGVVVAISSILSALAGSTDSIPNESSISRSAFLYFLSAFIITLAALIGRIWVVRLPFYRSQMKSNASTLLEEIEEDLDEEPLREEAPIGIMSVIRKTSGLIFTVGYIFIITLMLFPSITALIKSIHRPNDAIDSIHRGTNKGRFYNDDIFVAFHFLLFNVGDWVGRMMPVSKYFIISQTKYLVMLSASRTVFIPLFLLCNVIVSESRKLPVLIQSDLFYFILVWLFAITNGWICSLAMMAAPQLKSIKKGKEKAMVGSLMSFSLVLGLAIGGSLSFIARWMV
ncbi:nucleoside transporter-domain-containing protein [Cokeromyces recurvatus]|uniref:nucleoside transporter-domain-containing protein n=1 Tax=Cokeromyces recurvatus TaxID=90255 RepID=UPI00222097DF|nr:nucleoside transporter-domain-containing protein [Cokeromyces recurvatus]KAI7906488.1 nucleoside transporter-domain-containing protein [Cokeromyces recurvatus]